MTIDFRALCADLLRELEHASAWDYQQALKDQARTALAQPAPEAVGPSDDDLAPIYHDCCGGCEFMDQGGFEDAARAVLARWGNRQGLLDSSAPAPAEGEVAELVAWLRRHASAQEAAGTHWAGQLARAADLLKRQAAPVPVAVSERLPQPEDCDAEGRCWLLTVEDEYPQWRLHSIEGSQPGGETMIWVPVDSSPGVMVDCFYASHWLPAHALHSGEAQP